MTQTDQPLPTPGILQAMLRNITETLARELADPRPRAPQWTDLEWILARAVAAMHGVSPILSRLLRWQGPAGWTQFLDEQRAHTVSRHGRIAGLLQNVDRQTREAGIAAVGLKGAALHAMGLYRIGERPMADIDVLVRPADAERMARLLEGLNFRQVAQSWKERIFAPLDAHVAGQLGENADNDLKIELHERICERLPWRITDASELIFPRCPQPGLNAYPSKASLMIHILLHAAGSMTTRVLRLLHLQDIARLASQMSDLDWEEMLAGSGEQSLWWAYPPLALTSVYYPARIPRHVLGTLAEDCPYVLKRALRQKTLHDVSLSYLWVEALPGIEWSRSVREVLEYTANRVWPRAGHAALRAQAAQTATSADRGPWGRLSQGRRILRWATSRQARPVTMHSVHAALAQTHR